MRLSGLEIPREYIRDDRPVLRDWSLNIGHWSFVGHWDLVIGHPADATLVTGFSQSIHRIPGIGGSVEFGLSIGSAGTALLSSIRKLFTTRSSSGLSASYCSAVSPRKFNS